jgi:hypothetical protein
LNTLLESLPLLVLHVFYVVDVFVRLVEEIVVLNETIFYCRVLMLLSEVDVVCPDVILFVLLIGLAPLLV